MKPFVLLLYGPSGVGKTTLLRYLEDARGFDVAKKFTTRQHRGTVDDDRDFEFVSPETFPSADLAVFETYGHKFGIQLRAVSTSHNSVRISRSAWRNRTKSGFSSRN